MVRQVESKNSKLMAVIFSSIMGVLLFNFLLIYISKPVAAIYNHTAKEIPPILLLLVIVLVPILVGKLIFKLFLQRQRITRLIIFFFLGVPALLLNFAFGCCTILDISNFDPCYNNIISEIPSPNNKLKAVIFIRNCGATTRFTDHVVIIKRERSLSEKTQFLDLTGLPRSFFVADTNHGKAPAWLGGGPEVRLRWISDTRIMIQYHKFDRVYFADPLSAGVDIEYQTFD
jgi:hypothetical protein